MEDKKYIAEAGMKKLMTLIVNALPSAEITEDEVKAMWEETTV